MSAFADRLFHRVRARPFFYRFALLTRILMAAAFIPTGLVKLRGERFTLISPEHPIGAFFEAMYQTGMYWRFLGASQVVAGLLLLWPAGAHLGAACSLAIAVNIVAVTVSLGFGGTPIIAGLMLLAVVYLCVWDYHRFRPMFSEAPLGVPVARPRLDRWEAAGFTVFALAIIGFFCVTRNLVSPRAAPGLVVAGCAAGLFTLARFGWTSVQERSGSSPSRRARTPSRV